MTEKTDDELLHATIWLEKYPGHWELRTELSADPDDMLVGTDLHDHFAMLAVEQLHLKDGTQFRVCRCRRSMEDYVVRGDMAWTIKPLRKGFRL